MAFKNDRQRKAVMSKLGNMQAISKSAKPLKLKKIVESISVKGNQVTIILKNVNRGDSFSRSVIPMIKKAFSNWILNPDNQKKVNWTYISRATILNNQDYNLGYQDDSEVYYRYKGIIEIS